MILVLTCCFRRNHYSSMCLSDHIPFPISDALLVSFYFTPWKLPLYSGRVNVFPAPTISQLNPCEFKIIFLLNFTFTVQFWDPPNLVFQAAACSPLCTAPSAACSPCALQLLPLLPPVHCPFCHLLPPVHCLPFCSPHNALPYFVNEMQFMLEELNSLWQTPLSKLCTGIRVSAL